MIWLCVALYVLGMPLMSSAIRETAVRQGRPPPWLPPVLVLLWLVFSIVGVLLVVLRPVGRR